MKPILITGGRVIDPQTKCDDDLDLLIIKNEISKIGKNRLEILPS